MSSPDFGFETLNEPGFERWSGPAVEELDDPEVEKLDEPGGVEKLDVPEIEKLDEPGVKKLDESECIIFEDRFNSLFKGKIDSDCQFIVGPQENLVEGHKLIFSMASEVFYAMFYSQLKEDSIVRVTDLELDGFEGMKKFIYTGNVNFTSALHACTTYVAARKYLIPQLSKYCIDYISKSTISASEVLKLYEYCKVNEIPEIEEKCLLVIKEKTRDVVDSKYYLSANINTIASIIKLKSLNLESELKLFNHLERWVAAEAERQNICADDMASRFNGLKQHIRFLTMNEEEFTSGPAKSLLLTQEEKLAVLLNIMDFGSTKYPENLYIAQSKRNYESSNLLESDLLENVFFDPEKIECLLRGSIISDCEFIVGSQQNIVKGHKLIFSMASKVFHEIFNSQPNKYLVIKIDDLELDGFEGMKHFIYTGNVNFTSALQACSTYIASQKYSIPKLSEECIEYIQEQAISPSEILRLYEFSRDKGIPAIVEKCIKIIQEETEDVINSQYFLSANINTIDLIMSLQSLNLKSEIDLFNHFENWALAEAERKDLSGDKLALDFNSLKKHIRFLTMSGEEYARGPALSCLLTQEEKIDIGLNIMNLGSAPYPNYLSLIQEERNFALFNSEKHVFKERFSVSYESTDKLSEDFHFNTGDSDWSIGTYSCKGFLCFKLSPIKIKGNVLIRFKAELKILALKDKYNDLLIESEFFFAIHEQEATKKAGGIDIVIAVISWDKIEKAWFLDEDKKCIEIEGRFVFENSE